MFYITIFAIFLYLKIYILYQSFKAFHAIIMAPAKSGKEKARKSSNNIQNPCVITYLFM